MNQQFNSVTELAGGEISNEQLVHIHHRYFWQVACCNNKSVLNGSFGMGYGLRMHAKVSRRLGVSHHDNVIPKFAKKHYDAKVLFEVIGTRDMPFETGKNELTYSYRASQKKVIFNYGHTVIYCAALLKTIKDCKNDK
jgi:hypothetical protein